MKINESSDRAFKAVFILLSHEPDDCLFQHHLADTLRKNGIHCDIYSACDNHLEAQFVDTYSFDGNALSLRQRAGHLSRLLAGKHYDIAFCDTPLSVSLARKFATHTLYYITEWYPSKKNLANASWLILPFKFLALCCASIWAGILSDAFIFGEHYKALPFRYMFPWKKYIFLPYYPDTRYIPHTPVNDDRDTIRLCYAGPATQDKGFPNVIKVTQQVAQRNLCKKIQLTLITDKLSVSSYELPENLRIVHKPYVPFHEFCQELSQHDIFLDLRRDDFENTRCLPVKLFYYMASGRPVIYTDLKAIHKTIPEIIGDSLVNPRDTDHIADMICRYINDPDYYHSVCTRNRNLIETSYNWRELSPSFLRFIGLIAHIGLPDT